ncbi:hypothetical protein HAX54_013966 [Datura stramonium]|uniref:Uncharacterized protein n=1 Tax=Datura stramonium TaxID=4076 RepID=A0ABS8TP78_DATST|nr:hypothetical protein [Datura stramonium]
MATRLLGTLNVDPRPMKDLLLSLPYRDIRHTLSGLRLLKMSKVIEEKLQQLHINYPLSKHSRALCKFEPEFEESFDDNDAIDDEQA